MARGRVYYEWPASPNGPPAMVQLPMKTGAVDIGLEPSVRYTACPTMLKHKGRREHQVLTYGGSAQNLV